MEQPSKISIAKKRDKELEKYRKELVKNNVIILDFPSPIKNIDFGKEYFLKIPHTDLNEKEVRKFIKSREIIGTTNISPSKYSKLFNRNFYNGVKENKMRRIVIPFYDDKKRILLTDDGLILLNGEEIDFKIGRERIEVVMWKWFTTNNFNPLEEDIRYIDEDDFSVENLVKVSNRVCRENVKTGDIKEFRNIIEAIKKNKNVDIEELLTECLKDPNFQDSGGYRWFRKLQESPILFM